MTTTTEGADEEGFKERESEASVQEVCLNLGGVGDSKGERAFVSGSNMSWFLISPMRQRVVVPPSTISSPTPTCQLDQLHLCRAPSTDAVIDVCVQASVVVIDMLSEKEKLFKMEYFGKTAIAGLDGGGDRGARASTRYIIYSFSSPRYLGRLERWITHLPHFERIAGSHVLATMTYEYYGTYHRRWIPIKGIAFNLARSLFSRHRWYTHRDDVWRSYCESEVSSPTPPAPYDLIVDRNTRNAAVRLRVVILERGLESVMEALKRGYVIDMYSALRLEKPHAFMTWITSVCKLSLGTSHRCDHLCFAVIDDDEAPPLHRQCDLHTLNLPPDTINYFSIELSYFALDDPNGKS
ncbi:hypothetical protein SCHPADRAFT_892830 [Schizopora paradoxa]|uniref:Uncharacterized protein n=1 Tax=Schizopora paradoxa TaxID=27342 RepID=A0A0H2RD58_9AGAM|nr:hypothetical protein SCHPADRAFT_892830 [Schizopora paradoxa]